MHIYYIILYMHFICSATCAFNATKIRIRYGVRAKLEFQLSEEFSLIKYHLCLNMGNWNFRNYCDRRYQLIYGRFLRDWRVLLLSFPFFFLTKLKMREREPSLRIKFHGSAKVKKKSIIRMRVNMHICVYTVHSCVI